MAGPGSLTCTDTPSSNWADRMAAALAGQSGSMGLNRSELDFLGQQVAHEIAPTLVPDPTVTQTEQNHRCDVSHPAYEHAGGNDVPDPYDVRPEGEFEATGRPSGAQGAPNPVLRWGEATWGGSYIDRWPGWGYRHIQAKHGWSDDDIAATRAALLAPVVATEEDPTTMVYRGAEYTQNGALCQRRVVVQYNPSTGPKGIITSYGDYLGEAP
jgi:hypothetical protein